MNKHNRHGRIVLATLFVLAAGFGPQTGFAIDAMNGMLPPGVNPTGVNPFTGVVAPAPLPEAPRVRVPQVDRLLNESLGGQDNKASKDYKILIETAVLVGRTNSYAILGFPVVQAASGSSSGGGAGGAGAASGQSGGSRSLRTMTVKNGGSFYLLGHKLLLALDNEGLGALIQDPDSGGHTIAYIEIDAQRTLYLAPATVDTPSVIGDGVGQKSSTDAAAAATSTGSSLGVQPSAQSGGGH